MKTELITLTALGPTASLEDIQALFQVCPQCAPRFALFVQDEALLTVPVVKSHLDELLPAIPQRLDELAAQMGLEAATGAEVTIKVEGQVGQFTRYVFTRQHQYPQAEGGPTKWLK
jgi:hypothetical protein